MITIHKLIPVLFSIAIGVLLCAATIVSVDNVDAVGHSPSGCGNAESNNPGGGGSGSSCSSRNGRACTATNACGESNNGRYSCSGTCSARPPANPSGFGRSCTSAPNSCGGTNTGFIGCDGTCSAGPPTVPSNYGQSCNPTNKCGDTNSSGPGVVQCNGVCSVSAPADPNVCTVIDVSVNKSIVRVGDYITISWEAATENPETCHVTYPGGTETFTSSPTGTTGEITISITGLGAQSISVACPSGSDRQSVQVQPRVQET